jgi:hypothetical protein
MNGELIRFGDKVLVIGLDVVGAVSHIRHDNQGEPIYTVVLFDKGVTPDDIYYARDCEVRRLS